MIQLLALVIPLGLYLAIPSVMWNFDGVACAAALELSRPAYLFHADHLLYGYLGYVFWKQVGLPLGLTRALPALQLFTSLLAALGLLGLYRLIRSLVQEDIPALLLTLALSVTAAFWVWSIEAQVYTLGFLALAWATYVLIARRDIKNHAWMGFLHGGAVLGHLLHVLWIFPALYWMWGNPKAIRRYFAALFLTTTIPYALILTFVIAPGRDHLRILNWLKGSVGLTPDRSWSWHSAGWMGPWLCLKSTAPALWGNFWPYGNTQVSIGLGLLAILSIACFLLLIIRGSSQTSGKVAAFAWLWIGAYGVFLSSWEPETLCYRMTDIIPFGILLASGLRSWKRPYQIMTTSVLLLSTLALNAYTRIIPMHQPSQNKAYQEALTLSKITPPNSLYLTDGGLLWIYLPYFTGREAWNVTSYAPARLMQDVAREKRTRPVYSQQGTGWEKVP